ncbi:ATP-dependent RNA helicase dbp7, partial [Nowakowskiella sp. JEL0078]
MGELVLNFAVPTLSDEAPSKLKNYAKLPSKIQKSGSWKKLRIQKKISLHRVKKSLRSSEPPPKSVDNSDSPNPTTTKSPPLIPKSDNSASKQTTSNDSKPAAKPKNESSNSQKQSKKPAKANTPVQKQQKVTSLYSSNAMIPSTATKTPSAHQKATPLFSTDTFQGLGLDPFICNHLSRNKIKTPTAIQRAAIPVLLKPSTRDIVVQSQTGSGKTLTYALPVLHRLMQAEADQSINKDRLNRGIGALAIVLAPTRELAKQIYDVFVMLIQFVNHAGSKELGEKNDEPKDGESDDDDDDEGNNSKRKHWLVPGIVIGGEKKKSEKARLRKGINLLVSTPGRLLDHLKTTQSFKVENVRWVVFDEADRLMEMGFAETLKEILDILKSRREPGLRLNIDCWPINMQTVLCSATVKDDVRELAQHSLTNPEFIGVATSANNKVTKIDSSKSKENSKSLKNESQSDILAITVPAQLKQSYIVLPTKLRLVTLFAHLRSIILDRTPNPTPCKIIVFLSCRDSVDFHYHLFTNAHNAPSRNDQSSNSTPNPAPKKNAPPPDPKATTVSDKDYISNPPLLPSTQLFRLHGSLPQKARVEASEKFRTSPRAILLCTDVAARGIDLPDVTHIVQLDPPVETNDYVHRIGRTARIGKQGESLLVLDTAEAAYVDVLRSIGMALKEEKMDPLLSVLAKRPIEGDLKKRNVEEATMDVQMLFERFVVADEKV